MLVECQWELDERMSLAAQVGDLNLREAAKPGLYDRRLLSPPLPEFCVG